MNKKLIIIGCAAALASTAFAKKAIVDDDCAFCNGGISIIEDDPVPVPSKKGTSTCYFCGEGGSGGGSSATTYWTSATTRSVNMTDGDYYVGTVTIKTGKYSSKKGTVEVSASFKLKNGKKYSAKKQKVKPDEDWTLHAKWSNVKGIGDVALAVGIDGAVEGVAGDYEFSQEGVGDDDDDDDEVFEHGEHVFSVETGDYELNEDYDFVWEAIPEFSAIVTSNSKKWNCGKTPSIKYKKFKEDGEIWYELIGIDDEVKTNYSGLKLTFDKKKNTVKGSFKVYATNEGTIEKGKPKLKSYSFTLKGSISGSTIIGTATCKKLKANWTFVIE